MPVLDEAKLNADAWLKKIPHKKTLSKMWPVKESNQVLQKGSD